MKFNELRMDSDGYLTLTGRLKELIITAGGKNISPVALEDNIRAELSDIIGNVVVIGDHRKYLTCLITVKVLPNPKTMQPTDNLDPGAVKWCKQRGVKGLKTVQDFFTSEKKQVVLELYKACSHHKIEFFIGATQWHPAGHRESQLEGAFQSFNGAEIHCAAGRTFHRGRRAGTDAETEAILCRQKV